MGIVFESGYSLPASDYPLTHARILHSGVWLSGGTASASSTDADYYVDGPANSLTYERWRPTSVTANWAYDHGSVATCDCACIAAHTAGTDGSTLRLDYYDGSTWQAIASVSPTDDMPVMFIFDPVSASQWRIVVTGAVCEIGVVKFGTAMQMPRPIYGGHSPLQMSREMTLRTNYSETGEMLGRSVQRTMLSGSFSWSNLPAQWVRETWRPFQTALAEPFFIAWRPSSFSEVAYCTSDSIPVPSNQGTRDLMSVEMSVRGHAWD